jgi:superfamily II DNA or RNA helicase
MKNNRHVEPSAKVVSTHERIRLRAANAMKAKSNLVVDTALVLSDKEQKTGFLGFYNKAYADSPGQVITRLWMSQVFPSVAENPGMFKVRREFIKFMKAQSNTPSGLIRLLKREDGYLVGMPILSVGAGAIELLAEGLREASDLSDQAAIDALVDDATRFQRMAREEAKTSGINEMNVRDTGSGEIVIRKPLNLQQAIQVAAGKDAHLRDCLEKSLINMQLDITPTRVVVFAYFLIPPAQAQHLASKPWVTVRPIDLYPLMQAWHHGGYGFLDPAPRSGFAISSIAATLPKDLTKVTPKVNDDQITCDHRGRPMYIPLSCDNTERYEDAFSQAGQQPGGLFTLLSMDEIKNISNTTKTKLPTNIPVLVDWVNCRFSYTSTTGMLQVQNLSNCRVATQVHVNTWLHQPVEAEIIESLARMGEAVGVARQEFQPTLKDFQGFSLAGTDEDGGSISQSASEALFDTYRGKLVGAYLSELQKFHLRVSGHESIRWADIAFNSEYPYLRPVGRYLRQVADTCLASLDNLYARYSVSFTTATLPWAIVVSKYAPKAGQINSEAMTLTGPARNQNVDPNYTNPALPLWDPELGRLPHQDRIANQLRGSPDFAILPVQAGGGKTVIIITDILAELANNRSAPYLIMCPSHLVAQYVKEINFFTKGKLNVIPVNSQVLKRSGPERLSKVIESAPRNTVVVCDYDALKLRGQNLCYGTMSINVFPIAEILRQFSFGYVAMDESHYVKNDTSRSRAVMNLVVDIPKKRLASGTMAHDSPSDLAIQIAQLDPTLFGTRDEFNERFGDTVSGGKVIKWKPNAQQDIMNLIKSRVVVAGAMRKEWAALLPTVDERMSKVVLTEQQQAVYNLILAKTLAEIQANKALLKKFQEQDERSATKEGEEEALKDEDDGSDLAAMLKPYIARMEKFITAPDRDPEGKLMLRGADRISPKVERINHYIREHLNEGRPGKILIFTNYVESAEAIYEYMAPDLQKQCLLYVASEKIETGAAFEKDPRFKIMVGVENSMNTGLNLQFVSLLIRVETVWNPGTLEQGNSRLNRPNMKVKEQRDKVYFRWIVCDRTIDVTKISRLTSKIVAVAKFENADSPAYQKIPDLPVIKMSLDNIRYHNSWTGDLEKYAHAYRDYQLTLIEEYAEYKDKFIAQYGENFRSYPGAAPTPKDAQLMVSAPYTPGLEIAGQKELGLVRLDEFLRNDFDYEAPDVDDETDKDDAQAKAYAEQVNAQLRGARAHTEYGDGYIRTLATGVRVVTVDLDSGHGVRAPFASVFLFKKPLKTTTKEAMAELVELPLAPHVAEPATTMLLTPQGRKAAKEKRQKELEEKEVELQNNLRAVVNFIVTNGYLGLTVKEEGHSKDVTDALQALGFRPDPPYHRAWIKNHRILDKQMRLWAESGFYPDKSVPEALNSIGEMYLLLQEGKVQKRISTWKYANRNALRNFYRMEQKPSTDPKGLKFYPVVEDGKAYLALPTRGQAATKRAIQKRASGVVWEESVPSLSWFGLTPQASKAMLQRMVKNGIQISNIEQLRKDFGKFQKQRERENPFEQDIDE